MQRSGSRVALMAALVLTLAGAVPGAAQARWKAGGENELASDDLEVCKDGATFQMADNYGTELELRIVTLPDRTPLIHRFFTQPRRPLEIAFEGPFDDDGVKLFEFSRLHRFAWPADLDPETNIEVFVRQNDPDAFNQRTDIVEVRDCLLASLDIVPGLGNRVDPASRRTVRVAVLSSPRVDATQADRSTVRFGAIGASGGLAGIARPVGKQTARDVDHDGDTDVVFRFRVRDTGLTCDTRYSSLLGRTSDGSNFRASAAITPARC